MADELALLLRTANAVLWATVVIRIFRYDRPLYPMARRLVSLVLLFGMSALAFSGLVPLGLVAVDVARMVITAFTAFAALVALGILATKGAV